MANTDIREGYPPNSTIRKLRSNWLTGEHEAWQVWTTDELGNRSGLLREVPINRRQPKT